MDKLKNRDDINSCDKWNIELVYKDVDSFNTDYNLAIKELESLSKLQEDFLDNQENFKKYILKDEEVSRLIEKLAIYASSKNNEDMSLSIYQELDGKITNIYTDYSKITSSVVPRILKEDKDKIYSYIDCDELKHYKHQIDVIYKKLPHILDEKSEELLSSYLPVLESGSETASYLMDADMKFDNINVDGESKEFNEAVYPIYIRSKDRNVRKEAFKSLFNGYKNVKNTLASTYKSVLNNDSITSKLRKYNSSIEMYLEPKDINVKLYDNLINTVRNNFEPLYEYYKLKKEILGLDEFHLYDSYVSVVNGNDKKYSFEEGKDIVIKALSILGDDYINELKKAFTDRWIDKYPNKNKRGGAYSTGSYDTLPYVLLNYTDTYNDVSTLAHELGHSMHTYYSNNFNPYITSGYPIFLAEIASTTNELLLSNYMYKNSTDKAEKLAILNEKLDLFKSTIYRQTMFAEFEKIAHDYVDSGNVVTSDYLSDIYYKLNKDYFGDNVVVDDEIRYEWLRIPHFYTPFYVYQYATSLSISCYIAKNIINETPGFKEKYIEFLKSGGRDYPLEVLKIIDIDLSDNKVFLSAIDTFKETLDDFKDIYYNM